MLVQPSPTFSEPNLKLLYRSSGLVPGVWRQLRKDAPGLASAAILLAISFCASLLGLCFDHHIITGLRAWDKPAKFSFSTLIFAVTLGATLQWIRKWPRLTSIAEKLTGAALILEVAIIDLQAARHTTSHFNNTTHLNTYLFQIMGVGIATLWLGTFVICVASLFGQFASQVWGWSLRLGLVLTLIGSASGAFMVLPTPQQLAEGRATGRMPIIGSHTVGAPDGGAGLPFLGWCADHGDLRIAHFIGIHGLQALPLLALFTQKYADQRRRMRLLLLGFVSYTSLFVLMLRQALRGQSILQPDIQWLASFSGLVLITFLVALAILKSPDAAFRPKRFDCERGAL